MNARLPWSVVVPLLIGALTILVVLIRLSSLLWAIGTLRDVASDVRRNRLVGLGWLLVIGSMPVGLWGWWYLRSVAVTAVAVVFGAVGSVLVTYLPYRDEIKRGE